MDVILARPVDEHTIEVAGTPAFYRSARVPEGAATPLYLHGIPTSSDDWVEMLTRTGGVAPDLIGFGRSGKGGHLDYTVEGLAAFVEQLLSNLGCERVTLVGHDWGAAVAVALAQRQPERLERLVLCDPVPLLEGAESHRIGRMLRRVVLGELIMGSTPRWLLARTLRSGCARPATFGEDRIAAIWDQFDQGTQRATLRLYRAGAQLEDLPSVQVPTLVAWGERDPWLPPGSVARFGERLPDSELLSIPEAGHWPWLESSEGADRIADFVRG